MPALHRRSPASTFRARDGPCVMMGRRTNEYVILRNDKVFKYQPAQTRKALSGPVLFYRRLRALVRHDHLQIPRKLQRPSRLHGPACRRLRWDVGHWQRVSSAKGAGVKVSPRMLIRVPALPGSPSDTPSRAPMSGSSGGARRAPSLCWTNCVWHLPRATGADTRTKNSTKTTMNFSRPT